MQIYCKKCKKHRKHTPKKIVPILKNTVKEKYKSAICLTERTFIYETEDSYDPKIKVKIYSKPFTDRCYKRTWRLIA